MRKLRTQIAGERDFKLAMVWIIACCVLHSICNACGDADGEVAPEASPEQEDAMAAGLGAEQSRERVKRDVLAFMRATGEYKC